jgi:hypothetical protein
LPKDAASVFVAAVVKPPAAVAARMFRREIIVWTPFVVEQSHRESTRRASGRCKRTNDPPDEATCLVTRSYDSNPRACNRSSGAGRSSSTRAAVEARILIFLGHQSRHAVMDVGNENIPVR